MPSNKISFKNINRLAIPALLTGIAEPILSITDAAVVGKIDKKWGETPCAFVTLKNNSSLTEQQVINFCSSNMAKFKIPKKIIFGVIEKTSTGKTQKFLLRKKANQK